MSYNDQLNRKNDLVAYRQYLRQQERSQNARARSLTGAPVVGAGSGEIQKLESNLRKFLPESHMPGNVGGLNRVVWDFNMVMDFDFGNPLTLTPTTRASQNIQVTQEAVFILTSIGRTCACSQTENAPWQVEIRDLQSSRMLMDSPMPYQMIGSRSLPSYFTTPYLLMPNAKLELTMSTFTPFNIVLNVVNKHQFHFFGYRIRVEDADKVLSTIFGYK
jgi:hypothetical protein